MSGVREVSVSKLRYAERNPRRIKDERLAQLMRSLEADRDMLRARPLVALPDGTVLMGNMRLRAARELGWKTVPVLTVELDDERAKLWMLRDNQGYGDWDEALLGELLQELAAGGTDLDLAGFDEKELVSFMASASRGVTDPDEVPEPPAKPKSKPGEVYELGPHRLLCGDSTVAGDVERLLDGQPVSLICTYCSGGFQESGRSAGSVGTDAAHKQIANDRLSTRGYIALLKSAFGTTPAEFIYVFTDWRMWVYLFDVVESSGFGVRSMIVWDKGSPGMGRGWRSQHELVMWGAKSTPPFDKHAPGEGNVISAARTGNNLHTTEKPVELIEKLLEVTPFASTVYDPFGGSGTTLIACEKQDRACFAVELDPGYCDVIRQRYADYTGQTELAP